jgi:hypothetical protein
MRALPTLATLLLPALFASAANAIRISTSAALVELLAHAQGGEHFELAPGNYGRLDLTQYVGFNVAFAAPITIISTDPAHPAEFTGLAIRQAKNVAFDGIRFTYHFQPGQTVEYPPFAVQDSQQITFRNCTFTGDLASGETSVDNGFATGIGLSIRASADVTVEQNDINRFYRGLIVRDSDRVRVLGNNVHDMRSDGMDFAGDQSLRIVGNRIHAFRKSVLSKDHADLIQFWTRGTTRPGTDVEIRANILNAEGRGFTQTIFIRNEEVDEGRAGRAMYYRNLTIADNVIINAHIHGIHVGEADGVTIRNNTLIHDAASDGPMQNPPLWRPRIEVSEKDDNVTITGNASILITGPEKRPDWHVTGNVTIQDTDPKAAGFYDRVFLAPHTGNPADITRFTYRPGGPLDGIHAGTPLLVSPP